MRATIRDVSERAQVSVGTVSHALNAPHLVSGPTLARVLKAVDELGYGPSRAARSLAAKRTHLIGYPLPDPDGPRNPTLDAFLHALVTASKRHNLEVVLFADDAGDGVTGFADLLKRHAVDAFVLSNTNYDDPRIDYLLRRRVPMASFGRSLTTGPFPWVDIDGAAGTAAAVGHLVGRGHTRFGVIAWPEGSESGDDRLAGVMAAVEAWGLEPPTVVRTTGGYDSGRAALAELVDTAVPPTAVVTVHDDLAIGAQAEARRRGIRIGADMALTGFDDIPSCVMVDPALTSVRQPFDVVGEILSDLVVAALAGEAPGEGILVEPELIVRASSTGAWG